MLTFFLANNARDTSSGGGGSGDGSSGGSGVRVAVGSSGGVGAAASSVRVCSSRRRRPGAQLRWTAGSQRACGSRQRMPRVCNSVQRQWRACDSMQRRRRVCGSGRGRPAARLQWETVMAAASRQHNCDGGSGGSAKDGGTAARSQGTTATVMGNCGLRRALGGAVAEGGSKGNS